MVDPLTFNWEKHLQECINATEYCAFATVDTKGVWVNPVWFAVDKKYNIYFISQPDSRHMKNVESDSRVSVAIYRTNYEYTDNKVGIQLEGNALIIPDDEVETAYDIYYGRKYPDTRHNKRGKEADEYKGSDAEWKFVKITPSHLYYFDTRFFDEVRQEVPLKKLIS